MTRGGSAGGTTAAKTYTTRCAKCDAETDHYASTATCRPCALEYSRNNRTSFGYSNTPRARARRHASHNPLCRPFVGDIERDLAAALDWEGRPLESGAQYHIEHDHTTGKYYGLVPRWLNLAMTQDVRDNWPTVVRYAAHIGLMPRAADAIGKGEAK